jgi:hypothetical protein
MEQHKIMVITATITYRYKTFADKAPLHLFPIYYQGTGDVELPHQFRLFFFPSQRGGKRSRSDSKGVFPKSLDRHDSRTNSTAHNNNIQK